MARLDIPYFVAWSDSLDLHLPDGPVLQNYFESSCYDAAVKELHSFDQDVMGRQVRIIRGAFIARRAHLGGGKQTEDVSREGQGRCPEALSGITVDIAALLEDAALWRAEAGCNWYGVNFVANAGRFQLKPIGHSLYDGSCGVALYFAAAYRSLGQEEYRRHAIGAIHDVRKLLRNSNSAVTQRLAKDIGIGVGSGLGSIAYALARIAVLLGDSAIAEDAIAACRLVREWIWADDTFDLMGGAAGGVMAALAVYRSTGEDEALDIAVECGTHLLQLMESFAVRESRSPDRDVRSWPIGLAHGVSGIAYAAGSLYATTGDDRQRDFATRAMDYEDNVLARWKSNGAGEMPCSWCNGISGLVIARQRLATILNPSAPEHWARDANAGLNQLRHSAFDGPDHLCCGQFGRILAMTDTSFRHTSSDNMTFAMERVAGLVSRSEGRLGSEMFRVHPSISEVGYFPGFFQGLAGIGYALLRIERPDLLPNVLAFD